METNPESFPRRDLSTAQIIGTFGGGGAQRLAYNLALGLVEQGVRSYALALRSAGTYAEACDSRVQLISLGTQTTGLKSYICSLFRLRNLIFQESIDVVHIHGTSSLPFVILATRFMQNKPKIVFTWQDSESVLDAPWWKQRLMIWALRRCDAVSGSSRIVVQKLHQRTKIPQISVFHGGVPICQLSNKEECATPPMIIWLGRIVPSKDPQILIRAAANLRDEGLEFSVSIIGKPIASTVWYMEETKKLTDKLQLQDRVKVLGFLSDDELVRIMHQAEISVQTSHTEGLSIALMEQMMAGLSIVATDVGDTAIAVEDGVSGILIPPKDEKRLTDALRSLLNDPTHRTELALAARQRAVVFLSIKAMAQRAFDQYIALCKKS